MLIGREKEQGVLAEAFQADESRFVAVYGRRRVGKTYLIRESMGSTAHRLSQFLPSTFQEVKKAP